MGWKNIYINSNLVQRDTGKSYLFAMPKNGEFSGWYFWHPAKCVHGVYARSDCLCIGYTDTWEFKLVKKNNSMNITVEQFEKAFEKMDANIRPWLKKFDFVEVPEVDIIHVPEEHEPIINPVADKELVDE